MKQLLYILCLICLPLSMQAQVSAHGVCGLYGGNVLWNLKGDTLFIHGKGEMANYERTSPIVIGVTSLPTAALAV